MIANYSGDVGDSNDDDDDDYDVDGDDCDRFPKFLFPLTF